MIKEYMENGGITLSIAQMGIGHPIIVTMDIDGCFNFHNYVWCNYYWKKL